MEARELAARLDTWVGRGASPSPRPSRPSRTARRRKQPNRKRLAAAALLAALASGWLVLARHHESSASPLPVDPQLAAPTSTDPPAIDTSVLRGYLDPGAVCRDVVAAVPSVSCTLGRVQLDAELDETAAASALYVARSGARIAPRHGPAACARGAADERSWSRANAPAVAVGRYSCRIDAGRATIWWFDEHGIVAHVVAPDANLANLFSWWLTHIEH